ncbi:hypothetical protein DINM_001822 [Dirofilaria immitis]|nr:hypothetical protein [Dirofilaria immitis]
MAVIILPWYIYFVIRRSQLQTKAANNIKYTLLDFEMIHLSEKLEDWQEISNAKNSYISVKDEDIQGKHIAKVYRPRDSERDTSSKTAREATTESISNSKSAKLVSANRIISDSDTDDDSVSNSVTGSESVKVPKNKMIPIQLSK